MTKPPQQLFLNSINNQTMMMEQRTPQQLKIIQQLMQGNKFFQDYSISPEISELIAHKIVLLWSDNPHIAQIAENQIYLVLQGKCFEYIKNESVQSSSGGENISRNNDYLMVRKLPVNSYFLVYTPLSKYKNLQQHKKYQLMIDEKTLLGKISDETFMKFLLPLIQQRWKKYATFLKKVQLFQSLPQIVFYELSKYIQTVQLEKQVTVIQKGQKSQFVYFVKQGELQITKYFQNDKETIANSNYMVSRKNANQTVKLKKQDIFGIQSLRNAMAPDMDDTEVLDAYSKIPFSVETLTKTSLFKIDKRLLAIVVTSFQDQFKKKNKMWSSVNLNQQIQGQAYQSPQRATLRRNAQKIREQQNKARDIKLRFLSSSKRDRNQNQIKQSQNLSKQQNRMLVSGGIYKQYDEPLIPDIKSKSCNNFFKSKYLFGSTQKLVHEKESQWENIMRVKFGEVPKYSTMLISAYDDNFKRTSTPSIKTNLPKPTTYRATISSHRVFFKQESTAKLQKDLIRTYLQKKTKNDISSKCELIKDINIKKKQNYKGIKRTYSLKSKRKAVNQPQKKEIGEQLYNRMNQLQEHPLLAQIEYQRKKLEFHRKQIKSQPKISEQKKPKRLKKEDQLILIKQL